MQRPSTSTKKPKEREARELWISGILKGGIFAMKKSRMMAIRLKIQ
jgi:hypothetical protein